MEQEDELSYIVSGVGSGGEGRVSRRLAQAGSGVTTAVGNQTINVELGTWYVCDPVGADDAAAVLKGLRCGWRCGKAAGRRSTTPRPGDLLPQTVESMHVPVHTGSCQLVSAVSSRTAATRAPLFCRTLLPSHAHTRSGFRFG